MLKCRACESERLAKDGSTPAGRKRWKCKDCGKVTLGEMHGTAALAKRVEALLDGGPSTLDWLEGELSCGMPDLLVALRNVGAKIDHQENLAYFPDDTTPSFRESLPKAKRYLISAAQNATPIHEGFLASLEQYAGFAGAELVFIPIRYKNPTSQWTERQQENDWWASEISDRLYWTRVDLCPGLTLLGDVRTQPTAQNPLSGMDGLTKANSAIVAHPRLQLKTVATPQNQLPKILTTTGAVTVANYTQTKTGKLGEFHHTIGACLVEIDDAGLFHLRQINASEDGSFYDLDRLVTPCGVTEGHRVEALICGDAHIDFVDSDVVGATFGDECSILSDLRPKRVMWHDALDFRSRNHHERNDVFCQIAKARGNRDNVRAEVERVFETVAALTEPFDCENVFIPSNHCDALSRWIKETDWREDPSNAEFYLETALEMVRATRMTESGASTIDPFNFWGEQLCEDSDRFRFLLRDESYQVCGIECGMHGDKGSNGSRGSIRNLSKIGVKSVIGHSHSPGIEGGCYQVGTSSRLRLGYNSGPSSWLNSHCVIYPSGKRSLISIIDGRWKV